MNINRRHFILSTAGAGAAVAAGTTVAFAAEGELPAYASFKDPNGLIIHTDRTMETRRGAQGGSLTALEDLFVRNNLPTPAATVTGDPDAWDIAFEGVANPASLTLGELKSYGVESVPAVLQCSGNGRAFFEHETSGTQWSVGAAGNVIWTGVPLRTVIASLGGPVDSAKYLTGTGGEDIPAGLDPDTIQVERSVPLAAINTAILAYEVNGQPLPLAHGGPVRLVNPGFFGVNNVKYVKRVALTEAQSTAKIQQSGYRLRDVGKGGAADQPSMWEMVVKSWVTRPLMNASGRVVIEGVAMGGVDPVKSVEISLDDGKTWQDAPFTGPSLGRYAWRPFALVTDLQPGSYVIASRATDEDGNTQPESFPANHRGYGHNGWRAHAIDLVIT